MDYHKHLNKIVEVDIEYVRYKDVQYNASWKRRGGIGAFFTIVRPWDRFENISKQNGYDIFAKVMQEGLIGPDGSLIACIRDLRRYFLLLEAELMEQYKDYALKAKVAEPPEEDDPGIGRTAVGYDETGPAYRPKRQENYRPGTPEDGGHHALQEDDHPALLKMRDGVREIEPEWHTIQVVWSGQSGPEFYYLVDREYYSDGAVEDLPRLPLHINHVEYKGLPKFYQVLYEEKVDGTLSLMYKYRERWGAL